MSSQHIYLIFRLSTNSTKGQAKRQMPLAALLQPLPTGHGSHRCSLAPSVITQLRHIRYDVNSQHRISGKSHLPVVRSHVLGVRAVGKGEAGWVQ